MSFTRCPKGYFIDNKAARLGLKRCHGGTLVGHTYGVVPWGRCRYLVRCLGMSVRKWKALQAKREFQYVEQA